MGTPEVGTPVTDILAVDILAVDILAALCFRKYERRSTCNCGRNCVTKVLTTSSISTNRSVALRLVLRLLLNNNNESYEQK